MNIPIFVRFLYSSTIDTSRIHLVLEWQAEQAKKVISYIQINLISHIPIILCKDLTGLIQNTGFR